MATDEETNQTQVPPGVPPPRQEAPAKPPVPQSRLTVNRTAIYGGLPHTHMAASDVVPHRVGSFVRLLFTEAHPWRRTYEVGPEWQPLDLGWLADDPHPPSLIVVVNEEGVFRGGIPTPEVRAAALARTVLLGVKWTPIIPPYDDGKVTAFTQVRVPESGWVDPLPGHAYFARCETDKARITVIAVPGDGR